MNRQGQSGPEAAYSRPRTNVAGRYLAEEYATWPMTSAEVAVADTADSTVALI